MFLNNSEWLYDSLEKASEAGYRNMQAEPSDQTVSEEAERDIVGETEAFLRKEDEGNLAGWRLYYARDERVDEKHLDQIGGETLPERRGALKEYMPKKHVSISIDPVSVINALDHQVQIDDEMLKNWPKRINKGVEYYKIKRGAGRIFCMFDKDAKCMVFSLYQKDEDFYSFKESDAPMFRIAFSKENSPTLVRISPDK